MIPIVCMASQNIQKTGMASRNMRDKAIIIGNTIIKKGKDLQIRMEYKSWQQKEWEASSHLICGKKQANCSR